jgi:DNA invertase Pin-like site-specific DNA recombinase
MKLCGYIRVSTDRQAEDGFGPDVQKDAIRRWAKDDGHKIVGWFADEGVSGSNGLDSRRALPEAIELVRASRADGIAVYRLDRLARDLILQETLLREVRRLGGEVFSTFASEAAFLADDPDDPSRKLIRQILGAISEWERSIIALRLRSGRRRKAEGGGFAFGSPPFGFKSVDGVLVADEDEQAVVASIRRWNVEGQSIRAISERLNAENVPTRRGARWHPTVIARLLQRTARVSR